MLFKAVAAIAVAASLLEDGRQPAMPPCIPNPSMVGTWHFVNAKGDAHEITLMADGSWHEWISLSGQPSFTTQGGCLIRDDGQRQLQAGVVVRYETNPRSLILRSYSVEMRFLPGALAVASDRNLLGTWHLTRWKNDYSQARIAELTLSADGSFRRLESSDLHEPELIQGTFRIRPRRQIEFVETSVGPGTNVQQFQFRVRGSSLTLQSDDERQWFARGKERHFPPPPPPCEMEDPETQLARLGPLRPFELSTYSQPTDIDAREQNELLHRAMRAYLGSAAPLALKATEYGDEGGVYDRYLVVRAGRGEYLYTSRGNWTSGETGSCAITAMRLADQEGQFVEPSSGRQAPAVRLLFRSGFPGRNSFP